MSSFCKLLLVQDGLGNAKADSESSGAGCGVVNGGMSQHRVGFRPEVTGLLPWDTFTMNAEEEAEVDARRKRRANFDSIREKAKAEGVTVCVISRDMKVRAILNGDSSLEVPVSVSSCALSTAACRTAMKA